MAFGTGEHATTAMCLRLLSEIARQRRMAPWSMLDLGAGSGVLALAARVFGAESALGFDHDPDAVRTARANARANGIRRVAFRRLDLARSWQPDRQWPVIAANLFSGLIIALLPRIVAALEPGGQLVLSGILTQQAPEVESALCRQGFSATKRHKGRWITLLLTRKDP